MTHAKAVDKDKVAVFSQLLDLQLRKHEMNLAAATPAPPDCARSSTHTQARKDGSREREENFSHHASSAPFQRTRSGGARAHDHKRGSSDPVKQLESRSAPWLASNTLLPKPHPPKHGGREAGSTNPLGKFRRQASKQKLERVVAVRGSLKQRLHDYTAAVFFKQLSGSEQAAWWCGFSRAPFNSEEHATTSKEFLSAGDAEFETLRWGRRAPPNEHAATTKEYLSAEDAGFTRLPREAPREVGGTNSCQETEGGGAGTNSGQETATRLQNAADSAALWLPEWSKGLLEPSKGGKPWALDLADTLVGAGLDAQER